jgi:hypothetical protein
MPSWKRTNIDSDSIMTSYVLALLLCRNTHDRLKLDLVENSPWPSAVRVTGGEFSKPLSKVNP